MVLQVVILRDGLLVGTEVFVPGSYSVGSAPLSDLKLDDPAIQQQQAVLYFQNGKAAIQDMGGGVYVNGIKVTACEVRSMDEVVVGPFVLKIRVVAQKTAAPAVPPEVAALLGGAPPRPSAPSIAAAPPGASWPAMPQVPHAASQVALPAPELHPTPAPTGKPQGTVASARRIAQKVPLPAPQKRAKQPTTDEHALELEREPGTVNEVVHQDDRPTFVPGALDPEPELELARPQKKARGNGAHVREGQMPTATPGEGRPPAPALAKAARPPTAQQRAQAPEKAKPEKAKPEKAKPAKAKPAKAPKVPTGGGRGKSGLRLYYELHWSGTRHGSVSFGPESSRKGKPILGSSAMGPEFPYWGFDGVPRGKFAIAQVRGDSYRLFVPSIAKIERRQGADFQPVGAGELDQDGDLRYMTLGSGGQARFTSGGMTLYATVAPPPEKVKVNPLKGLPWLLIALLVLIGGGGVTTLVMMPKAAEEPDFTAKGLDPVAVRLAIQPPEKKEKAKQKVEKIKKKEEAVVESKPEKKITKQLPKQVVQAAPAETKALKQLAKLAAAGPAMGDMLAAVDKLGNGPGAKNAKSGFHLSGLVGKQPIANAGLGTFGLGGGGKGGVGTLGAEILRGRGGGGIGAMGAGGVGHGAVGGMVTHATSRSVGVPQGNIDREAVAKTINAHLQEVRGCYERALLKDPGLAGKVVLEWTIGTTGSVTAAKTKSSTLKNATVEGCILSALKTWQFPQPRGGVVIISYPFLFNSVGF